MLGQGPQGEPNLLLLAVHVDARVDLLLDFDVLGLDGALVVVVDELVGASVDLEAAQAPHDHDVVLLHGEGEQVAQLLRQTDLDEAPQVQIRIESLNAVEEVGPGVGTAPTKHVDLLLVKSAATGVDALYIH